MNASRIPSPAFRGRLPRLSVSVWAVLVALLAQFGVFAHVHSDAHVGGAHHHHAHHDHGHDHHHHHHDDAPSPAGPHWTTDPGVHTCGDACPVQLVPTTHRGPVIEPLAGILADPIGRPTLDACHLVAHDAVALVHRAPKTSPPRS